MSARPLPPVVGATENALRSLLTQALANSALGGYDEWVYFNVQNAAGDPAHVEELVADALRQLRGIVTTARARLTDAGLFEATGALTGSGHES